MRFDSAPGGSARGTQWMWFITLLGLAMRLFDLAGESLWLDEIIAAGRVNESFHTILFGGDSASQGPLFPLWMKLWETAAGTDEWSMRIWPALWGTLCIPAVYYLARQLFTNRTAVIAALIMAVHPFAIHYSQDARPYSLFLLCSLVSSYLLLKLLRQHRWPMAIAYILATAATVYVHPFAAFLVLAHVWMYFWFRRERRYYGALRYPRPYVWTFIFLCIVCLPEGAQALLTALGILRPEAASWIEKPPLLWALNVPANYFLSWTVGAAVLTITMIPAVLRGLSEPQLRTGFQWMLVMAVCFWFMPWLISVTLKPITVLRYVMPGLTVVILLMAVASTTLQSLPRQIYILVLLGLTITPLWDYYTKVDKDPWRQATEYLAPRLKSDDRIVAYPYWSRDAQAFYLLPSQKDQVLRPESLDDLKAMTVNTGRLWLVNSYDVKAKSDLEQQAWIQGWGVPVRTVIMDDLLPMNPNHIWCIPIRISLYERKLLEPPAPLPPDSTTS